MWSQRVNDPRGRIPSGIPELDELLYRGGFAPQEFVIFGGRTGTRKTTVTVNLIANMLQAGTSVGFIGLDEAPAQYAAKVCSAVTGVSHEYIEDVWDDDEGRKYRDIYREVADKFTTSRGYRPKRDDLEQWLDMADHRPQVVFLDYASLLFKDKYSGGDAKRIPSVLEELQIFANEQEVVTIVLHQVNRQNDMTGKKNHGDRPLTPEDLAYGGEAIPDIILQTYRPSKDPLGNMDRGAAEAMLGDSFDEDMYLAAVQRVKNHKRHTFLQLTKNRPGTKVTGDDFDDICLVSPDDSMQMVTDGMGYGEEDSVDDRRATTY